MRGISLRLAVSKWLGEAAAADVTTAADEDGESIVVGGIGADGGGGGVYCSTRMSRCRVCGGGRTMRRKWTARWRRRGVDLIFC